MVFDRVITPEIYLGLKKNKESLINSMYSIINKLPSVEVDKNNPYYFKYDNSQVFNNIIGEDISKSEANYLLVLKHWLNFSNKKVFYFGKDFSNALVKTKLDFPPNIFNRYHSSYIVFPENYINYKNRPVWGVYILCHPVNENNSGDAIELIKDENGELPTSLLRIGVDFNTFRNGHHVIGYYELLSYKNKSIEENIQLSSKFNKHDEVFNGIKHYDHITSFGGENFFGNNYNEHSDNTNFISFITKCLTYILSQNPNVDHLKPNRSLSKSEKHNRIHKNMCSLPITLVNWDYMKNLKREYHIDETVRSGHFRWQACGPQWSKVKLIWVKEHEIRFKKGEFNENNI